MVADDFVLPDPRQEHDRPIVGVADRTEETVVFAHITEADERRGGQRRKGVAVGRLAGGLLTGSVWSRRWARVLAKRFGVQVARELGDLDQASRDNHIYVGMSRARNHCVIVAPKGGLRKRLTAPAAPAGVAHTPWWTSARPGSS